MAGRHLGVLSSAARRTAGRLAVALGLLAAAAGGGAADDARLSPLCIDESAISVSGISSGGFMAHQFHVAHSAEVMGAGIIAGGPYACAGGGYPWNMLRALSVCSAIGPVPFHGPPDASRSIDAVRSAAAAGRIDDPGGLRGDRVFLFSARQDELVPRAVVDSVADVYRAFDDPAKITAVENIDAPHAMLTEGFGNPCDSMKPPFINACGFDLAGAVLRQMYGSLSAPKAAAVELRAFSLGEFDRARTPSGMAERGFIYIPGACTGESRCRLHIVFHGCGQSEEAIGDTFARHAGYNEWAEANGIVILYPQAAILTRRVAGIGMSWPNPEGCWDWWGFTGSDYAEKSGPQIAALSAMVDRLVGRTATGGTSTQRASCAPAAGR